jgi:hypothetical protein
MKHIILVFLLSLLAACGKDTITIKSNLKSTSLSALTSEGVIIIPSDSIMGGSPTIEFKDSTFYVNSLSTAVSAYLASLKNRQSGIAPVLDSTSKVIYKIKFNGTASNGTCPFNPAAQCMLMNVSSILAY